MGQGLAPATAAGLLTLLIQSTTLGALVVIGVHNPASTAKAGNQQGARNNARAIEIARSLGDASRLYAAITQLCNYNMVIAQYDRTAELTSEFPRLREPHRGPYQATMKYVFDALGRGFLLPDPLAALATASVPPVGPSSIDVPLRLSLLPALAEGWSGRPALSGFRAGNVCLHPTQPTEQETLCG